MNEEKLDKACKLAEEALALVKEARDEEKAIEIRDTDWYKNLNANLCDIEELENGEIVCKDYAGRGSSKLRLTQRGLYVDKVGDQPIWREELEAIFNAIEQRWPRG